jgi:SAM-dependent methyltransferase
MADADRHALGYHRVDDDRNVDMLIAAMRGTARWSATLRLRSWERTHLGLDRGERLLDVGCGLGDAALDLAHDLGDDGEVVGVDLSERMLRIAHANARAVRCRVRFTIGDASSLDEPDDSFDAVRSERTLQWLADPGAAVVEMVRVVRPGGRVSLIDTDWSTFTIDVGDHTIAAQVRAGMRTERNRASNVGRRLHDLVRAAGCVPLARTQATQVWTTWDPDASPAPLGCFSMNSLADGLVASGHLATVDHHRFVSTIHDAARRGEFRMSLTMFAVVAVAPEGAAAVASPGCGPAPPWRRGRAGRARARRGSLIDLRTCVPNTPHALTGYSFKLCQALPRIGLPGPAATSTSRLPTQLSGSRLLDGVGP